MIVAFEGVSDGEEAAPAPNNSDKLPLPATWRSRTAADSRAASLIR